MEFYFQLLHSFFLQGPALRTRSFRDHTCPRPWPPACLCSSWWSGFLRSSPRLMLYLSERTSGTAPEGRGSFLNFKDHISLENAYLHNMRQTSRPQRLPQPSANMVGHVRHFPRHMLWDTSFTEESQSLKTLLSEIETHKF